MPGILQSTEIEIDQEQARDIRRHLEELFAAGKPIVLGRDWRWIPESGFIVVWNADGEKVASFNPDEVAAVYAKGEAERVDG